MLVEDSGKGIQTLAKLGEAFFELNGFAFVHFKTESQFKLMGFGELRSYQAPRRSQRCN